MARNFLLESFRLLGFQIGDHNPIQKYKSFAIPANLDGASQIASGGIYGTYVDLEGTAKNEAELITRYRDISCQPEADAAIEDIITDAIVQEDNKPALSINLDKLEQPEKIKTETRKCFDEILKLLNFNEDGMEIFKRWYVDGRLFYHIMIDPDSPEDGIKELRNLDPRRVRKIREIKKKLGEGGVEIVDSILEYYLYNERGIVNVEATTAIGVKIAVDSICYVHSGLIDSTRNMVVSYLHKAIKPLNQLRAMEDAHVIYRLSRAAERRVFYVDVGNMPTNRAEQYIKIIMNDFRNKLVYDSDTGQVRDDHKFLSMQEDFFLPRREGGKGTEVTTLPAGCIALDTKIKLLDGRSEELSTLIEEFNSGKENWVYSCDPNGHIVPGLIEWAGVTRKNTDVMKIYLDNGTDFTCTPDHTIPIIGRGKVDARDLIVGDSLIPLYEREEKIYPKYPSKYKQIYQNDTKKWEFVHRVVSSYFPDNVWTYNENYLNTPKTIIHHKNFNRYDNSPNNLIKMSYKDHLLYHSENNFLLNLKENDPEKYKEHCENVSKRSLEYHKILNLDPKKKKEIYEKVSKSVSKARKFGPTADRCKQTAIENFRKGTDKVIELYKDPIWREKQIEKQKEGFKEFEGTEIYIQKGKNLSNRNHKNFLNPEYKEKVFKNQTIKFDKKCLDLLVDFIRKTNSTKASDIWKNINNATKLNSYFIKINKDTTAANFSGKLGLNNLNKLARKFGYKTLAHLVKENQYVNHRIIKIEYLEEKIDVGNLTISENAFNSFHTYALDCGIFVGNSNLGQIEDIMYFQERLYKALHVPASRLKSDAGFGVGREAEISRDEVKFSRFITKLRKRFDHLLKELLKIQLELRGIITKDEWEIFRENIDIDYSKDSVFSEAKDQEIWTTRFQLLAAIDPNPPIDRYISREWVFKNVLKLDDDALELMKEQIKKEKPEVEAEAEKAASLDTGAFFEDETPPPSAPKKKTSEKKKVNE